MSDDEELQETLVPNITPLLSNESQVGAQQISNANGPSPLVLDAQDQNIASLQENMPDVYQKYCSLFAGSFPAVMPDAARFSPSQGDLNGIQIESCVSCAGWCFEPPVGGNQSMLRAFTACSHDELLSEKIMLQEALVADPNDYSNRDAIFSAFGSVSAQQSDIDGSQAACPSASATQIGSPMFDADSPQIVVNDPCAEPCGSASAAEDFSVSFHDAELAPQTPTAALDDTIPPTTSLFSECDGSQASGPKDMPECSAAQFASQSGSFEYEGDC